MVLNKIIELSMVLDEKKFKEILSLPTAKLEELDEEKEEYIDNSLEEQGIQVRYRHSQYKKKVIVMYSSRENKSDGIFKWEKEIRNLERTIKEYFGYKYKLKDFKVSKVIFSYDINIGRNRIVREYIKIFRRMGKIKKYSLKELDFLDKKAYYSLEGNSNGVCFTVYDLESLIKDRIDDFNLKKKKMKSMIKETKGILRIEICIHKLKAIDITIRRDDTKNTIEQLLEESEDIFLSILKQIIPYGNYYKKEKAIDIISKEVEDKILRRKMIRLVALIPEKKSLHMAQKSMSCNRDMEKIMKMFSKINLSPVTIGKRQGEKYLDNFYKQL